MFPDARISLRRWNVSAETKIPIPVAITLHNFFPPSSSIADDPSSSTLKKSSDNDTASNNDGTSEAPFVSPSKEEDAALRRNRGMWLRRQPQHNNNLLPRLRMEITATPPYEEDENKVDENSEEQASIAPRIVYSGESPPTPCIHPSWEHLDERISVDECSHWWDHNELYKSMTVKFSILSESDEEGIREECESRGKEDDYFLESFLYPSFLERIDLGANNSISTEDIDRNSLLPPGLPPNAILVHFSDGSIRCPPQIYHVLWDNYGHSHGILEPPPVEDFSRFEDRAFATLDHVKQTPQRPRNRSVSSLLDQDPDFANQNDDARVDHGEDDPSQNGPSRDLRKSSPQPEEFQKSSYQVALPQRSIASMKSVETNNGITQNETNRQHNNVSFRFDEKDFVKEERRQQKRKLLQLIAMEEGALAEDINKLSEERRTLISLMEEVQQVDQDISKLEAELNKQSLKLEQEEILKESQSVKLLRDLRHIYPISLDSSVTLSSSSIIQPTSAAGGTETSEGSNSYLIRGLRLPADIYTTTISEEEVNTSLGYCAHLVFMVAKYLAIQLRHRIFCNGSRSAIELDGVGILPLFLGRLAARALEREQVDRGARLLGSNVDCIMTHLDLMPSSSQSSSFQQSHILERLQTILNFVADGENGQ